jgi:DUF2934 family protein
MPSSTATPAQKPGSPIPGGDPTHALPPPTPKPQPDGDERPKEADGDLDRREVAGEAYALYLARGCEDGYDLEDWLSAEEMVRQRRRAGPTVEPAE